MIDQFSMCLVLKPHCMTDILAKECKSGKSTVLALGTVHPPTSVQGVAGVSLVSSPDHTHIMGVGLVTLEHCLGCAESAINTCVNTFSYGDVM